MPSSSPLRADRSLLDAEAEDFVARERALGRFGLSRFLRDWDALTSQLMKERSVA